MMSYLKKAGVYLMPFVAAGGEAFIEYLVNTHAPLSRDTLVRAAAAALLVETAFIKRQLDKGAA